MQSVGFSTNYAHIEIEKRVFTKVRGLIIYLMYYGVLLKLGGK